MGISAAYAMSVNVVAHQDEELTNDPLGGDVGAPPPGARGCGDGDGDGGDDDDGGGGHGDDHVPSD
eukprot:6586018-Karenia_brevis.AAC.1